MAPAFLVALLIQDAPLVTEERPRIELLWTLDQLGRVNESCTQFAVSPDGKWLTLWSGTGHFMLWEVSTGKLRQDKERVKIEQFSRNEPVEDLSPQLFLGNDRLAATYARKKAGEWDIGSAVLSVPDFKVEARFPGRFILAIAQDGRTTLSMTFKSNKHISHDTHFAYELWDLQTKKMLHFLDIGKHMRQFASSFRLGGKELLAYIDGSFNCPADAAHIKPHVRVFDTATGKETGMVKDVEVAASLAPDGKTYALDTGALDLGWLRPMHTGGQSVVSIKNRRTGRETYARPTIELLQRGRVVGLHYLPDSRHVVVVTSLAVMIWDTEEDEVIPFKGKLSRMPVRVRFTQTENGLVFATVSSNGDMQVWRASLPAQKP